MDAVRSNQTQAVLYLLDSYKVSTFTLCARCLYVYCARCLYIMYMVFVHRVHGVCTSCAWCLYIVCMVPVHRVHVACTSCARCLYIMCTVPVHHVHGACTSCARCLYIVYTVPVHRVHGNSGIRRELTSLPPCTVASSEIMASPSLCVRVLPH